MSPEVVGIAGIILFLVLSACRMPLGISFAVVSLIGFAAMGDLVPMLSLLGSIPYRWGASEALMALPLFVLMGFFAYSAGIVKDSFDVANIWAGKIRGSLAFATIAACAGFAACCGSSIAETATMSAVAYPEMKRYNYDTKLAVGCIASAGALAILIPPSTTFIIYALLAEESTGKLFIAGILPGVLLTILLIATVFILVRMNPSIAPPSDANFSWKEKFASLKGIYGVAILALIIMGGIFAGVFTATEAASVGAVAAFMIALIRRKITRQVMYSSVLETVQITSMIFLIVAGAMIFNSFLAVSGLPADVSNWLVNLPLPAILIVAMMMALFAILGCFMDAISMMILTLPFFLPAIRTLGFSPIWFGVLLILMVELAFITPPVGLNVFTLKGVLPEIPLDTIFRGVSPFVITEAICVVTLVIFPQISLFLPSLM